MRNFKVSVFQVFLLSLGLNATFAWSQQSADSVLEPPLQRLNNANDDLEETSASDNVNFIPLIFDAVLIDYAELSETDDELDDKATVGALSLSVMVIVLDCVPLSVADPPDTPVMAIIAVSLPS